MEIIDNRGLLLRVRDPKAITTVIPTSRQVANNDVLVRWGVDESRILKNLNIKNVPSPILGRYDWPGRYKPFEHQKTTAAFLTLNKRAFCFNEQGTGKTAAAIWASDFLLKEKVINRVLIICSISIMESAWLADLFNFATHRSVDIAYGNKNKRAEIVNGSAEYIIINYDGVEIVQDHIKNGRFDLIIVDEATHYKNAQSKRWKVLNNIIKPKPNTWVWLMTGTPAAQSPLDAYGLAKLVNPYLVPPFFSGWRDMVMTKVTQFKWVPRPGAIDKVFNALQPAIRYTKEQCLDLPELIYVKRKVELTPQQIKYYEVLKKQLVTTAAGETISAVNAAVSVNKLLQISCGAVYSDSGETVEFDIKNRYNVLKEVIDESSQKVLVFVPYKHVIALLSEKLAKDGITNEIISGDVNPTKRTEVFKKFQTEADPRVLIIQPQAAAHGVTLTAANTIVWWGPVPSLETYAQANARIHRAGQKHPCTVIQLKGSKVEEQIYNMLNQRINIHEKILDLYSSVVA